MVPWKPVWNQFPYEEPSYKDTKSLTDWAARQLAFLAQPLTCIKNKIIATAHIHLKNKGITLGKIKTIISIYSWNHNRSLPSVKITIAPADGALWPWQCPLSLHLSFPPTSLSLSPSFSFSLGNFYFYQSLKRSQFTCCKAEEKRR